MPKKRSQSRLTSYAFLLINTICWGAALIVVKPAFETTTAFRFLLYRYALAIPLSLPLLWKYRAFFNSKNIRIITVIELIGTTLALGLLYAGLERTTAIEASLLTTTTPIFVVLAGMLFLKENQEKREWFGLLLAFLGTILLTVIPTLNSGFQLSSSSLIGNLLIIGQNIATAIYFILAKRWYKMLPPLFVTTVSYFIGFVSFLALSYFEATSISLLVNRMTFDISHLTVLWASFYMALFGSIIGLTAYIKGQEGVEASEASLFWYLQPLVYLPLGFLLLQETINFSQVLSLCIIFIGVLVAEKRN